MNKPFHTKLPPILFILATDQVHFHVISQIHLPTDLPLPLHKQTKAEHRWQIPKTVSTAYPTPSYLQFNLHRRATQSIRSGHRASFLDEDKWSRFHLPAHGADRWTPILAMCNKGSNPSTLAFLEVEGGLWI
jgi:hypothetical protein